MTIKAVVQEALPPTPKGSVDLSKGFRGWTPDFFNITLKIKEKSLNETLKPDNV